jgi:hypothetical protein
MRKLPAFGIAGVAAALAATAAAGAPGAHRLDVPLPDGSVAHIEYFGDVAPKVTMSPRPHADVAGGWAMELPSFAGIDRMIANVRHQNEAMLRRAQEMSRRGMGAMPYIASYGNLPEGGASTTVVSVSTNGSTCTRTTQMVSQGQGRPPKVTSSISGQCGAASPSSGRSHPA